MLAIKVTSNKAVLLCAVNDTVSDNAATLFVSFRFSQAAKATPRGTYIRPMGLAFGYLLLELVAPIMALSLSLLGAALCRRAHNNWGTRLDKASELLSVIPLPLGLELFRLIPRFAD